jgi:hypothetical protein
MKKNRNYLFLLAALLAGCITLATNYGELYGPSAPRDRIMSPDKIAAAGYVSFDKQVQPILNQRCIVCHSCYDAPCQLDLTSYEGLDRGADPVAVYNLHRFSSDKPTRLGIDASTTAGWRALGFHPVLNERADTRAAHLDNSLLYQALLLKRGDAFPTTGRLPAAYDINSELRTDKDTFAQSSQCPTIERFDHFARQHPQWGMPFGLPALSEGEFKTIETWLAQGSPVEPAAALPQAVQQEITKWEKFFNGESNKQRLMARYLYEHLFLGHLFFDQVEPGMRFMLVRSRSAPGQPIDLIHTVRPYDDPGVGSFYYRLQRYDRTIVDKTHLPYALNNQRLSRLKQLFLEPDYAVQDLPGYEPQLAANPFKTFAAIPPRNRYQFMLDDAHFIIAGFIKGPVCRGSIALSVIDDHFWVLFSDPDGDPVNHDANFMAKVSGDLRIPSEREDNIGLLKAWHAYYDVALRYFMEKVEYLNGVYPKGQGYGLAQIWDGDKVNRNAALTVYRHYDSASVVHGFVGEIPKTGWVLDYPLLERIHYLLVAGFNVYGTAGHQLATRTYMDFLRMEAELNFLVFLPRDQRLPLYRHWYRDTGQPQKLEHLMAENVSKYGVREPAISYETTDGKKEFFVKAYQHLGSARSSSDTINWCREFPAQCAALKLDPRTDAVEKAFRRLSNTKGEITDVFPNVTFVRVTVDGSVKNDLVYTLVRNKSYLNTTALKPTEKTRVKSEDTVDVVKGFVGAYPNFFLELRFQDLQAFVDQYVAIDSYERYDALMDKYGIRRSNPQFWQSADWFQAKYRHDNPIYAGVFDLSRYQNR